MLNGSILGSAIASRVLEKNAPANVMSLCYNNWIKISTEIVNYIKERAIVQGMGCTVSNYSTQSTMSIEGMNSSELAKNIRDAIIDDNATDNSKSICYDFWKNVADEIVKHIQNKAKIDRGISCVSGGSTISIGRFQSNCMNSRELAKNIRDSIIKGKEIPNDGKSKSLKIWTIISEELISHIEINGVVNPGISGVIDFPVTITGYSGGNGYLVGIGTIS